MPKVEGNRSLVNIPKDIRDAIQKVQANQQPNSLSIDVNDTSRTGMPVVLTFGSPKPLLAQSATMRFTRTNGPSGGTISLTLSQRSNQGCCPVANSPSWRVRLPVLCSCYRKHMGMFLAPR